MNSESKTTEKIPRRTFIDYMLGGGLMLWAAGILAPIISYLAPAQSHGPGVQTVSVGPENEFGDWQSKTVAVEGHPVVVVRTPQGFHAVSAVCTHLGCIVHWDEKRKEIACPCHAGFFGVDGKVISGPPNRDLAEYGVVVINGEVLVKSA